MSKNCARKGVSSLVISSLLLAAIIFLSFVYIQNPQQGKPGIKKFDSCSAMLTAFKNSQKTRSYYVLEGVKGGARISQEMLAASTPDYSTTNIQVEGVDEADIVKTDGKYIYTLSENKLIITNAYPPETADIVSETDLEIVPREIFIGGDMLLIFGNVYSEIPLKEDKTKREKIYPYRAPMTVAQLWDVTNKENPRLVRSLEFEGNYLSSRKIGPRVYFVVNSYPRYYVVENVSGDDIVPLYRDLKEEELETGVKKDFEKTCRCFEVSYFEPVNAQNFVTIVSMSMDDPDAPINKEVIVGTGQNIYASLQNLYIAETTYSGFWIMRSGNLEEKTVVYKFALDNGNINYVGSMEVPGRILNQFSMDEYNSYFRIATTKGRLTRTGGSTSNNIYIYNDNLNLTGKIEDIAPGESIYSARFMGDRVYLVTFKKIDPFFVIDLSDPENPKILGKLKIPGYSDYLHPYDENHIIGIGKETVEAEEEWGDFAWYQGLKIAIFDVTDVENPKELHKIVIGDRGTDSEVLRDHKAFLFDREKNLLVIPVLLAEIKGDKESLPRNTYGEYVFQGAYVYRITLKNGFELMGRITHYNDTESFMKSGYYFRGDGYSIRRSLYIDNVLYTISERKIKLNSLEDLKEIKELNFD
jgi:uncharacterized secreted protein with C-terminal beta-propeller domain